MSFFSNYNYRNLGLLFLRVTAGLYMAFGHGWGKIAGGPERWADLGGTMELFGLGFAPVFWGFMSAIAEFVCALLVTFGFAFRAATVLLILNMATAAGMHIITGNGSPETAILYGLVWAALLMMGPGAYSVDARFSK